MREGWKAWPLGSVAQIVNGGTPDTKNTGYWNGGIPWLTPKDMGRAEDARMSVTSRTISEAGLNNSSARLIPAGSVILSTRAPIGHLALNDCPMAFNQGCRGLVPRGALVAKYLFYFLLANVQRLNDLGTGTTFKELSAGALSSVPIPVPPLAEQQRIVAILDEAFEAIAAATANAEKNLANARELFEQGLRSAFASLAEPEQLTLQEVATTFARGKSKHRPRNDPNLYGGPYPFIQTGNVREAERYIVTCDQSYNENGLSQSRLWPKGTVCITIAANIAETGILGMDACFPDSVIGIIVDPRRTTSEYVEYALRFFREKIRAMGKGSAQDNINLGTFETTQLPFPILTEQKKLVKRLDLLAGFSKELEEGFSSKLTALAELKQSLLARAFSGALTAGWCDDAPHTPSLRAEGEATQGQRSEAGRAGSGLLRRCAPRNDGKTGGDAPARTLPA